jgi:hypothetical protein
MTGQRVNIDIDPTSFTFHCPVCGHAILRPEHEPAPCAHCTFVWIDALAEFDEAMCTPEILARMKVIPPPDERIDEDEFEWVSCFDKEFLGRLPNGTIAFFLSWSGFACGPVSETVVVGIDFVPKPGGDGGDWEIRASDLELLLDDEGEEWKRGSAGNDSSSFG